MFKLITTLIFLSSSSFCLANDSSTYAGEETREIKSLSKKEQRGYLAGKGMGLAKAAELNGYPGPRHVLDLSDELALTEEQISKTNTLFFAMQSDAMRLGSILIKEEKILDDLFANDTINHDTLKDTLSSIGKINAEIRHSHLAAHIEQKKLLSPQQVSLYIQHRGYETQKSNDHQQHQH